MTLPENVKIPGATGLLHPLWLMRWKGIRDGKSQVRQVEGGYSTPYIGRIYGRLHTAMSKTCREAADRAARQRADRLRERVLVIHLEEQREPIKATEERLTHWCRQAHAAARTRLSSYWDGVLKTSGDGSLPPFPTEGEREVPGLASVRRQADSALTQIPEALHEFEKGAEQNEQTET